MEAAFWGLLGTIAGAGTSIATTLISSRHAARLQSSAVALERREKSRSFQRDTLIELQDAMHDEVRATSLVYQADEAAFRKDGRWGSQLLGDELNTRAHLATRRTALLVERVSDDDLRDHVKVLRSLLTSVQMAREREAAEMAFLQSMDEGTAVMEHIGKVLRSLYADTQA